LKRYIQYKEDKFYPSKIVCVGRNYVKHIQELGNELPEDIVLFIKPNSSITDKIILKRFKNIHYEGELSFLIGENINYNNISDIDKSFIKGIGFGFDFTLRELQSNLKKRGLPWEKSKSFDGAAFFSNFYPLPDDIELDNINFSLKINGEIKQKSNSSYMIFKPLTIIKKILEYFSLNENDIIMTGTPEGVGILNKGDLLEYEINNILSGKVKID
jgi:2-keto-4-pentenoate hydratase/2-oxohepta-3-ene-1,7-dioic acid hydratase in catechol pathway